jgi:M6 family metalloprotease-like protein
MNPKAGTPSSLRIDLIVTIAALLIWAPMARGAPLRDEPVTVTQPDGTVLHCFATGDEFHNWLHDKAGYTIIQDPVTGYYTYAARGVEGLVATPYIPGTIDPSKAGLEKGVNLTPHEVRDKLLQEGPSKQPLGMFSTQEPKSNAPTTGSIYNIAVFIRFSDEAEFTDNISLYDNMFNNSTSGANSLYNYYREVSYNQLSILTHFYPTTTGTVLSYQDSHPRSYYQPYNAVTNPDGYEPGQAGQRENALLVNAVNSIASQVPTSAIIDADGDGYVDSVCFIVRGALDGWSDLLWPHQSVLGSDVYINGKKVFKYDFQLEGRLNPNGVGVLAHEMFHTLGAPDLYHYDGCGNTDLEPVWVWDVMDHTTEPPTHMSAYMKWRYGRWIPSIPKLTLNGTYTLNPLTSSTNNVFRVDSPNSTTEYFIVEYRRRTGAFESSLPGEGMLVYRINSSYDGLGNPCGPPDEVYVYRPGGTPTIDGERANAFFSSGSGRTAINDTTNPSCFLSSGAAGGLKISEVDAGGSTISFKLASGTPMPDFVVTEIVLDPVSPYDNLYFNATIAVKNQGDQTGDAGWLDVWANQPAYQNCNVNGDIWIETGFLAPGETKFFTFIALRAGAVGTKTFRVFIDSTCRTEEFNENNQYIFSYSVQPRVPDFVVTGASLSPASPEPNSYFSATVSVKNQGDVAGDAGWLDVWTNQAAAQSCGADGNAWVSAGTFAVGETKSFTITGLQAGSPGTMTFRAFIDSACSFSEYNESNNQYTLSYNVQAFPDFVVTGVTLSPASPAPYSTFSATVTVQNQGGPGDSRLLDVWVDQATAQNCGANGDKWTLLGPLAAGETKSYTFTGLQAGIAGTKTFRAFIDSTCFTPESNEGNNQYTLDYAVQTPSLDLIVSTLSGPSQALPGQVINVSDTTKNQGTTTAGASTTRYYLSLDTDKGSGDVLLTGSRAIPSLATDASSSGTAAVTIPLSTALATYYFLACADDLSVVSETDETNNCRASAGTVQVSGGMADLVETAVSTPPSTASPGDTFQVTDTVMNEGSAMAGPSTTRFYLSLNTTRGSGDVLLAGTRSSGALLPQGGLQGSVDVTIPASTAAGTYYLLACADDLSVVSESDETNNCRASAGTVQVSGGMADLVETAVSTPPSTASPGDTFQVTDTVMNEGGAMAGPSTTRYYLSLNTTRGSGAVLLAGTRSSGALLPQGGLQGSVDVTIPGSTAAGTYYLLACADDLSVVSESDETNNCIASGGMVKVGAHGSMAPILRLLLD